LVAGSARKGGNTDTLCAGVSEALSDEGFDIATFRPYDMEIGHCTNCGRCRRTGTCVIGDSMSEIYSEIREADVVVMCTPVHFSGVSSILKQVIDRLQCLWTMPSIPKKRVFGVVACGGSPQPIFRNIVSVCKAVANTLGAEWGGELTVPGTDAGVSDGRKDDAYTFGIRLAETARS